MCVHARRSLASFVALVGAINANRQFKTRVNNNIAVCTKPVRDAVCVREYHPIAAYKVKAATCCCCLAVSVEYEISTGIVPCALCAQWFTELTMIVKKKNCSSIKLCPAKYILFWFFVRSLRTRWWCFVDGVVSHQRIAVYTFFFLFILIYLTCYCRWCLVR